jgi:hypothetical protein
VVKWRKETNFRHGGERTQFLRSGSGSKVHDVQLGTWFASKRRDVWSRDDGSVSLLGFYQGFLGLRV